MATQVSLKSFPAALAYVRRHVTEQVHASQVAQVQKQAKTPQFQWTWVRSVSSSLQYSRASGVVGTCPHPRFLEIRPASWKRARLKPVQEVRIQS